MISNSRAYLALKTKSQEFLDFVHVACTAVPTTNNCINAGALNPANFTTDHFGAAPNAARFQAESADYQLPLARMIVFSMFSYFEAYVPALLSEIVEFHGGAAEFQQRADKRAAAFRAKTSTAIAKSKAKLQEYPLPENRFRYENHSTVLLKEGFRFPSELLAPFGVKNMIEKAKPKGMKAHELHVLIREAMCFDLSKARQTRLEAIRDIRNTIAHGDPDPVMLNDSLMIAKDLRKLALDIDKHAVQHFFVLEAFT